MFLLPKESLRLSIHTLRSVGFSNSRDFHLTKCAYLRSVSAGRRKTVEVRENESSPAVAGEFSVTGPLKNVNDNFFGIESDEGVIKISSNPSLNNYATRQFFKNVEQEKLVTTTFGTVRYDSENKPKQHGQLEKEKVTTNSALDKDKIRDLNQALLKKNSVGNCSMLSGMEKDFKTTTDVLDRNSKSKLPNSSYVDEIYFPASYSEMENITISSLESSPSSSTDDKLNLIEESYFSDKMTSEPIISNTEVTSRNIGSIDKHNCFPDKVESTAKIADKKVSSFQSMKSTSSPSNNDKSNLIEECYFNDKIVDESMLKNIHTTSDIISNPDKNHPYVNYEKPSEYIEDDKQSSFFDDHYFNTVSGRNVTIDRNNLESVINNVDVLEEKDKENSKIPLEIEKNKMSEKVFIFESEVCNKDSHGSSLDAKRRNTYDQETLTNVKTLFNVNKNIEEIGEIKRGEQLSFECTNPSLEELGVYNKFMPTAIDLPKTKNNFLFQSKEFLKKSNRINSKSSPGLKKLRSFQRNFDETDTAEKSQNNEEVVKSSLETEISKVQKGANVKNAKTVEQPETAYGFVKQLRSSRKKLEPELINGKFVQKTEQYDSKGFRILKHQVPDLKYYTRDEILELLVKNVLYSDDDLVVLNKPYNLVMHDSKTAKDPCLSQYLEDLASELDKKTYKPKLITVHRIDKETSGCLLLARSEISAQRLLAFFSQRKIIKTYWIVTTKVPDPLEGVIDMPISEGFVNSRARMVLHPDLPKDIPYRNHSKTGKRAVTHYKVIAESGNAALVEARPETGIKHQIRVHFGFGLSCPILGDHKYSHLDKLAPQILQADLLQKLQVRQSKVRHIPMHLYARSIFIPQYKDGRNLFVMAPMPIHMSKNLQKLKFRKK